MKLLTLKKTLLASIGVLVLTVIHHFYGAAIYEAPFQLHVAIFIVPILLIQILAYHIYQKHPSAISGKSGF